MDNLFKKENATNIVKKFLDNLPNLKSFLAILMKDVDIETKEVGRKFQYPQSVTKNKLCSQYGIVMDCFIRKHLSNQFSIPLKDDTTELVLNNVDTYFTRRVQGRILPEDLKKHYMIFKDPKTQAMDVVHSVKKVALSTYLYFHDPLPNVEVETNNSNLLEIIKYFKTLSYSGVEIKSNVDCDYFEGNADIIFEQKELYEIKNSQFSSLNRFHDKFDVKVFYKLILYGFGYYKKTGKIIKCFKIYNPLLGQEHKIKINDIDMELFESAIKKDLGNKKLCNKNVK